MQPKPNAFYWLSPFTGARDAISPHAAITVPARSGSPTIPVAWSGDDGAGSGTGTLPTDFGFTGQRNEGTIELYDYRARYYDPALGRFVSADTVVPNPGDPQDLNRYAYVRHNPLRYTDPSGHWTFEETPNDPYFIPPSELRREAQRRQDFVTPHEPTIGEVILVLATPYASAAAIAPASVATTAEAATFVANGTLATVGYTGGVVLTNWSEGKPAFEGWLLEEAVASFVSGGVTSFMPGKGFAAGFSRGAAQAGSAYLLGQGLKGEPLSVGEATASTVFGGMGGGVGDIVAAHLEVHVLSHARSGTSAMAGRVGVETIGPTADAFFSFLQEQFMKHLQSQDSSVVRSYQLEGPVPATGPYPTHNRPDFE